jgi:hypothetical protein
MPALLQDAYTGKAPAEFVSWPGGVGAPHVPIPLRGGGVKNLIAKFNTMSKKNKTLAPKFNVWNRSTNYGASIPAEGGYRARPCTRRQRRRPTRKAQRKAQHTRKQKRASRK